MGPWGQIRRREIENGRNLALGIERQREIDRKWTLMKQTERQKRDGDR